MLKRNNERKCSVAIWTHKRIGSDLLFTENSQNRSYHIIITKRAIGCAYLYIRILEK